MNATVHRLMFIDPAFPVISLVNPSFIRPSSVAGGMFNGGTGYACVASRESEAIQYNRNLGTA
ncbi:hypothetical protein PLUA15_210011 [Pseudomonas lundensis]|uniref:Uncharacterized protein n=1 Tax=Pseudomonas lundensis TaxID=86185 RepID=A0AAX2H6U7_9PSED|nr:hypothetical protein PLUA15_210011 [Pseudomonas lundensis]